MKITYLVSKFPKLSETFVLGQITSLIDRGHDVEIVSIYEPDEEIRHDTVDKYNLPDNTHYLRKTSSDIGIALDPDLLKALVFTDIIHAHFAAYPASWAMKLSRMFGIPYVVTTHAYDIYINPDIETMTEKFDSASRIVSISEYNRNYLSELFGNKYDNKIDVIRCGIDTDKFKSAAKVTHENIRILFVGRLIEKKAPLDALKAFAKVCETRENAELRIIGSGEQESDIKSGIREYGLENRVVMLGEKTRSEVMEELAGADIFFLPSKTAANGDREGIPVSILEASSSGVPVASTRHTGIPEAVIDGETGFLVQERDIQSMAEKLIRLIENPELRFRMGKAGRERVEKYFTREREIDELEKLFSDVIADKTVLSSIDNPENEVIKHRVLKILGLLSDADTKIVEQYKEINSHKKEIKRIEKEIMQKEEQIDKLQVRLNDIEGKLLYKAYAQTINLLSYFKRKL